MLEVIESINWSLVAPFILIQFILMIIGLVDWAKHKQTNGPRWMWLFINREYIANYSNPVRFNLQF